MVADDKTMASAPSIRALTERLFLTSAVKTQSLVSNGFTPSSSTTSAQPRVAKSTAHVCPASVCMEKLAGEQGRWRELDKKLSTLCFQLKRRQLGMVHEHSKNFLMAKKAQLDGGREADIPRQLAARLNSLEQLTDEEATESSSGEEVERDELSQSRGRHRRLTARFRWEQHQASLRSRWAIIRARIAETERKIHALPMPSPLKPMDDSKAMEGPTPSHQPLNSMPLSESVLGSALWAKLCSDETTTAARTRPYTRWKRVKLIQQQTATQDSTSQVAATLSMHSLSGTADLAYHADLSTISGESAYGLCCNRNGDTPLCMRDTCSVTWADIECEESCTMHMSFTEIGHMQGNGRCIFYHQHTCTSTMLVSDIFMHGNPHGVDPACCSRTCVRDYCTHPC